MARNFYQVLPYVDLELTVRHWLTSSNRYNPCRQGGLQAYYYWLATSTCPDPGCAREGRRSRTGGNQPALPSDLCTLTHLETWSSTGFWISGENVQILQPGCLVVEHWLSPVESTGVQCTIIVINDRDVWPCPQRYTSHWLDHFCERWTFKWLISLLRLI